MRDQYLRYIQRGIGHTTMIAKGVKDCNGIMICASQDQANENRKRFGISTISMNNLQNLRVNHLPVVFDNHAIDMISGQYEKQLSHLQRTILRYGLGHSDRCTHTLDPSCFCSCHRLDFIKEVYKQLKEEMGEHEPEVKENIKEFLGVEIKPKPSVFDPDSYMGDGQ